MRLGGSGRDPAIDWAGTVLTYAEFDEAVDRWPAAAVHDASELSPPEALVCVFAAVRQGAVVHVEDPAARPHRTSVPDGAFLLVGTSGSTGTPRPLARTAASWTSSFEEFSSLVGLTPADKVLVTGPLHATMHLFGAVHALWLGACVTDNPATATAAHAVPAVLRKLLGTAPDLRTVIVAGTALDRAAEQQADGLRVVEYYGAAELSLVAARIVPSSLTLLKDVEAEVRDGLLFVRSPYAALGTDEWVGVGDIAELGPGRELVVHGRGDAAIDVGGTTVLAEDVERVLGDIDGVRAAAAIATPHAVLGATVTAVIELEPGGRLEPIKQQARARLQSTALPRRWTVVEELPRTGSGKIARGRVKDSYS